MNQFFIFLEEEEAGLRRPVRRRPESIPGSLPGGRAQTGAGQKGQKKTQNEKERKRTDMHPADGIVGNRPAAPNPVRLSAAAQEILADTRACYKVKENSNSKRK